MGKKEQLANTAFWSSITSEPLTAGSSTWPKDTLPTLTHAIPLPAPQVNRAFQKKLLRSFCLLPSPQHCSTCRAHSPHPAFQPSPAPSSWVTSFLFWEAAPHSQTWCTPSSGFTAPFGYRLPGLLPFAHSWPPSCPSLPPLWL